MEAFRYWRAIRRWWWMIALFALIGAATGAALSLEEARLYASNAVAVVNPFRQIVTPGFDAAGRPLGGGGTAPTEQDLVNTYAQLLNSAPVRHRLISLGIPRTDDELRYNMSARVRPNTTLIDISVQDTDPRVALRIARETIPAFNSALEELQAGVPGDRSTRLEGIVPWEIPTTPPTTAIRPVVARNVLEAFLAALVLALGLAFLLEYLDNSVKNEYEVRSRLNTGVLGQVILQKRVRRLHKRTGGLPLVTLTDARGSAAENFRAIRTNLLFSATERELKTIVVTSSIPREGKTSVSANLALTMAQAGNKVILVDADFRRPSLHRAFGLDNIGLGNMILKDRPLAELIQDVGEPNLKLVCAGAPPPNPADALGSKAMRELIDRFKEVADVVIFDTPPVQVVTDAVVMAAGTDGTILVVERGRTSVAAIGRTQDALEQVGANVLGVVLNKVPESERPSYYYVHYSANGKGPGGGKGERQAVAAAGAGTASKE